LNYQENIDLTQFAKGMYFLKVNNQVMKLIKVANFLKVGNFKSIFIFTNK